MSWDELETRVHQEVSKRLDVAAYRVGLQPGRNGLRLTSRHYGNFFFTADELRQRVGLLHEHLPNEATEIVTEANEICRHRFQLLGYRDLDYGTEIDWHLDAAHGMRAPLIPWFKINFLDLAQVGDHKVTWELSRHQHLDTLAKAWLLTDDETYAREIFAQWYSWQRANPYPLGTNWASSLEVAFRSLSWIWVQHLLADCPATPTAFQTDLLRALALNGRHIERYLSTYFSPNTHLLGEAVALFFIGTLYPQLSSAEDWKKKGWRIIQEQVVRQVRPDGVYFEQSLYYHVYALDFFLHTRLLASRNGIEIPPGFDLVIKKMLAVIEALAQTGSPDGFGDDDGGRVFNPRRNRAEHMTDPLAIGAALFHDENLRARATLTEEAIWLFGEDALACNAQTSYSPDPLKSRAFPDGGLYSAASSEPFPQQMVIDAGPQGDGSCGHGHADALSVKLAFGGRNWLVDAGTSSYLPEGGRNTFRGTRAHNTLAVDGLDQADPAGPFAWNSIPKTQTDLWITGTNFTLFAGSHSGYERLLEPVRHRRFMFHLHGSFWLIRDIAEGSGSHLLETSWHFAPELQVATRGDAFVAAPRIQSTNPRESHLSLIPVAGTSWKCELLSEHISPAYGAKLSAPVLRCSARIALPAEHGMLLIPAVGVIEEGGAFFREEAHRARDLDAPDATYQYKTGSTTHRIVFRRAPEAVWNFGPWKSDARFLYFCVKDRRVDRLVFCAGSFLVLHGKQLISHNSPLQWLEWTNREGREQLTCSDESVAGSFSAGVLDSEIAI